MTLAIINHKGGAGKTTTTINLGCVLASLGKKVLLVDFDAQGSLTYSLGLEDNDLTIGHALLGQVELIDILKETEDVSILPGGRSLADAELEMARTDAPYDHLTNLIDDYFDCDFTLIDCPPSLSILSGNALVAATDMLIPMQMDVLALKGLDSILSVIDERKKQGLKTPNLLGVLPVMITGRRNLENEIMDHIRANYGIPVFEPGIRNSVKAAEAPSFGMSVFKYAPTSTTAQDYFSFTKEFLQLTNTLTLKN